MVPSLEPLVGGAAFQPPNLGAWKGAVPRFMAGEQIRKEQGASLDPGQSGAVVFMA
jgi:hypothetical protein